MRAVYGVGGGGMIFVCPAFKAMPEAMLRYSRLYAGHTPPIVPAPAPEDGVVILDSGAFGAMKRGAPLRSGEIVKLRAHYERVSARMDCVLIAPDVVDDPAQCMVNYRLWVDGGGPAIAPVFQFTGEMTMSEVVRQARFYAPFNPCAIAFVNLGWGAPVARIRGVHEMVATARKITGCDWVHGLGYGWNLRDIDGWRRLGCFDSIDSISYYMHKSTRAWDGSEHETWQLAALRNASLASEVARR